MKKRINVIDLDNTLIRKDSLKLFVMMFLKRKKTLIPLSLLSLLRLLGFIDPAEFLKRLLILVRKDREYDRLVKDFSDRLFTYIDPDLFNQVLTKTDENTINVLCTASPSDYVKFVAEKLNWHYIASTFAKGNSSFTRMYGSAKVDAILTIFPKEMFDYSFAISDNASDLALLRLFDEFLIKK